MLAGMTLQTGRNKRRARDEVNVDLEVARQCLCQKMVRRPSRHTVRLFPLRWTRRGRASRCRPHRRPGECVCRSVTGAIAESSVRVVPPSQLSTLTLQQGCVLRHFPAPARHPHPSPRGGQGGPVGGRRRFSALAPHRFSRSSPGPHNSCVWTSGRGSFAWAGCPWP